MCGVALVLLEPCCQLSLFLSSTGDFSSVPKDTPTVAAFALSLIRMGWNSKERVVMGDLPVQVS